MNSTTGAVQRLVAAFLSHRESGTESHPNLPADPVDVAGVDTERLASSLAPLHVVLAALVRASTRPHCLHLQHSDQHSMCRVISPIECRFRSSRLTLLSDCSLRMAGVGSI
jgi:hypothetical protein